MAFTVGLNGGSYIFTPGLSNVGTVQLFDLPLLELKQILTITNVTDGIIIYNFADGITGSIFNNIITLTYNTSMMNSSDELRISLDLNKIEVKADNVEKNDESIPVFIEQMEKVFGNVCLIGVTNNFKTENYYHDQVISNNIIGLNSQYGIILDGMSTATIQLTNIWVGTQTFEATVSNGDWVPIFGYQPGAILPVLNTTTNGLFRFNVTGLKGLRVRFSAYTSGTTTITIGISAAPTSSFPYQPVGSQSQILSQKATSYELNTYDTNLATVLGSALVVNPQAQVIPIAPVSPTLNAGAVGNIFQNAPQIYPRVRVESAGAERLPFAQEKFTNKMQVASDTTDNLLRQILTALKVQNCLFYQWIEHNGFPNLQVPDGYEDILTKIQEKGD